MNPPRGGFRPGSGRKRLSKGEPTVMIRARVPESYKLFLKRVGKGSISAGLRQLIKNYLET